MSHQTSQLDEYLSLRIIEVGRDCDHSVLCCMSQVILWKKKETKQKFFFPCKNTKLSLTESQNEWEGYS